MENRKIKHGMVVMIIISSIGIIAGCEQEIVQPVYQFLTESKLRIIFFGIALVCTLVSIKLTYTHLQPEGLITKISFAVMWIIFSVSAILAAGAERYFIDPWPTVGICGIVFSFIVWTIMKFKPFKNTKNELSE